MIAEFRCDRCCVVSLRSFVREFRFSVAAREAMVTRKMVITKPRKSMTCLGRRPRMLLSRGAWRLIAPKKRRLSMGLTGTSGRRKKVMSEENMQGESMVK